MSETDFKIHHFMPILGLMVSVKTNWSSYVAYLKKVPDGVSFQCVDSSKCIQTTTVIKWVIYE